MKWAEAFVAVDRDRAAIGRLGAGDVVGQDEEASEVVRGARVRRPLGDERALHLDRAVEILGRRGSVRERRGERGAGEQCGDGRNELAQGRVLSNGGGCVRETVTC